MGERWHLRKDWIKGGGVLSCMKGGERKFRQGMLSYQPIKKRRREICPFRLAREREGGRDGVRERESINLYWTLTTG